MKFDAEVVVKLKVEASTKEQAEKVVMSHPLFIDVCGYGFEECGHFAVKTTGEQWVVILERSEKE